MAKLFHLRPVLWTNDVRTAIDRRVNAPGFSETACGKEWRWSEVEKEGAAVVFSQPNVHPPYNGRRLTGSLYTATDGIEALWQERKDRPRLYYGIETFAYGMKGFAIREDNGYILQFGQAAQA